MNENTSNVQSSVGAAGSANPRRTNENLRVASRIQPRFGLSEREREENAAASCCAPRMGYVVAASARSQRAAHLGNNMRSKNATFAAVAAMVLGAAAQAYADDIVIYNTGVGDDGLVLAPGSNDPHYRLVSRPAGAPIQAVVAFGHDAYVANDPVGSAGSSWLCQSTFCDDFHDGGDYTYRTSFDLTGLDPATASLTMSFAVDDTILDVRLNGVSTGISGGQFVAFGPQFAVSAGFTSGVNTLDFIVFNAGNANPTGFRCRISGTANPSQTADETAPSILGCADVTMEYTGAAITLTPESLGITAVDDVDGGVEVTLTPSSISGLGFHTITATAVDAAGNEGSCTFVVELVDTTAPVFTLLTIDHSVLWTPDHKMVHLVISAECDDSGGATTVHIVDVASDESAGKTADWEITGDTTLDLRAERDGSGDGRVYTITVECTDASGNSTTSTLTVSVPHDNH
jgi:HYR domain-containing protein